MTKPDQPLKVKSAEELAKDFLYICVPFKEGTKTQSIKMMAERIEQRDIEIAKAALTRAAEIVIDANQSSMAQSQELISFRDNLRIEDL